jgi:hypothetical protein
MSSIPPPPRGQSEPHASAGAEPKRRRPVYLTIALIAALVFGAGCWTEGCSRLAFFRGEQEHQANLTAQIQNEEERARADALFQRFVDAADAERGRAVPLAAATFVLGAALLALAARGLSGRANTRSAIMQIVAAQAVVVALGYFVTRGMMRAESDWQYETAIILQEERSPPEQFEQIRATLHAMRRWAPPAWLGFRSFASLLIILALSRPRAREFFDAADALPEP